MIEFLFACDAPNLALLMNTLMWVVCLRLTYKHGIWDGAFNQSHPGVKKVMEEYKPGSTRTQEAKTNDHAG